MWRVESCLASELAEQDSSRHHPAAGRPHRKHCPHWSERTTGPVNPCYEAGGGQQQKRGGGKNVLRDDYRIVQTPQTFDISLAKQAFNQGYKEQFTDDASVVESLGCQVAMVDGNRENIKITTPFDIKIAEALLSE